jgi:uncharacterized protein (TIGR03382 family)
VTTTSVVTTPVTTPVTQTVTTPVTATTTASQFVPVVQVITPSQSTLITTPAPSTLFLVAGDTVLASTGTSNAQGLMVVGVTLTAAGFGLLFASLFRRRKTSGSHG